MPRLRVSLLVLSLVLLGTLSAFPASAHSPGPPPPAGTLETLALFNPAALETPESVILDDDGNVYLSLALTGEIRKIRPDGTQSTLAFLPLGGAPLTPCFGFFDIQGALALGDHGDIFVSVASCDLTKWGI